ncbi:MAG: SigB/SigF/SigG family RNA polymerase sigma factor [Thermoleophilia bacterium]|nr:SigB/SigF/SigG family RNA polymerase sigma factor [Thermoleophilia bacterium]
MNMICLGDQPSVTPQSQKNEKDLLHAYCEHGSTKARDELITRYLPLVYGVSRRYSQRGEQLEDLVQVGCIGLIKAIDRFDLSRGVALSTYATPNIIGEIKRYFRDKGWAVKVPRGLLELNMRLEQVSGSLAGSVHRSPSIEELADAVDATPEEVMEAIEAGRSRNSLSLDHSLSRGDDDDDRLPLDTIGNFEDGFETAEHRLILEPGFARLSNRERTILHQRFFEGLTQSQIAANIGVSQMHVSRLIRRALAKVRTEIESRERKERKTA